MFFSHIFDGQSQFEKNDQIVSNIPIIERSIIGIIDLTSLRLARLDPNLTYA